MVKTMIGLYPTYEAARDVVRDLQDNGIQREDISLVAADAGGAYEQYIQSLGFRPMDIFQSDTTRMGAGQPLGELAEMLSGLSVFDIHELGKVIIAGPLVNTLASEDVNNVGLPNALTGIGVPRSDAQNYADAVRKGAVLIAAYAVERVADRAVEVMNRHDPLNAQTRDGGTGMQGFVPEDLDQDHILDQPAYVYQAVKDSGGYVTEDLDQDHTLGRPVRPTGEQDRTG